MSRPADTNVYAEIRKSTVEPDSNRQNDGVSNGGVASGAGGHQLNAIKAEGKHDSLNSLQDLTLIENFMYKTSAECSKPAQTSDSPGTSYAL